MKSMNTKLRAMLGRGRDQRGSVLVIVVGVLALMVILVAVYATIGQTDRRASAALKKHGELEQQIGDVTDYLARVVGDDVFKVVRVPGSGDPTLPRDPNTDRYERVLVDNPSISPFLHAQTLDPALRYRPGYVSADNVPNNEKAPPAGQRPGSVVTPWLSTSDIDPREATSPFLASSDPTWLRLRGNNGKLIDPRDPQRPWLDLRDWDMISNVAPDGRFINLATLRNNWGAKPGVGLDNPAGLGGNRWRTTSNLTLLDADGNPTLDLALPTFWPFGRTDVRPVGNAGTVPFEFFPYDFTARQRSMFRPLRENRAGSARLGVLPRLYTQTDIGSIVPADWEYFDNQYADADGDGIIDSRWFEFKDVSDPGRDGRFSTDDDLIRNLIRESPDLRIVAAARIIDLSGKVNVNTATQWRTAPDAWAMAGALPSDIDLERQLRLADAYNHWPRTGYEGFSQPLLPAAAGFPSNYRQPSYGGTWNTSDGVTRRIADDVGGAGFAALIEAKVTGLTPPNGRAWEPNTGNRGFFRPLSTPVGIWPFDAFPGQQPVDYSHWTATDRARLYRLFARDPGSWLVNTADQYRLFADTNEMLPPPDGSIVPFADRNERLAAGSYITPGFFTIQDEIELRTFEGVNDPRSTSRLEAATGGRFSGDSKQFIHLSPFRDNRPMELETLGRDLVSPNQPLGTLDGQMDPDAFLQVSVDARRRLTTLSGGRPLVSFADVTGYEGRLRESDVKIDLSEALASLSGTPSQVERQRWVSGIVRAAGDSLLPYSGLGTGGPNPQSSAWFVFGSNSNGTVPRAEHKLHYGGGRAKNAYTGNSAELALRLSSYWAANLIAGRRAYSTYRDPANPIHPDDRTEDLLDPRDSGDLALNTNRFIYPPRNPIFTTQDYRDYALRPRWPREADRTNVPPSIQALRRNTTYTDGFEFIKRPDGGQMPTRGLTEAADRPVILSTLIDEGMRYRMGLRADQVNPLDVTERYVAFPGWTSVAQTGDLAPRVAAKHDLGASRLAPALTQLNPGTNPDAQPPRVVQDTLLSQRAMNVYGVTPQPFIVQALGMMLYVDTPIGRPDSGDREFDRPPAPGGGIGGGADVRVTILGRVLPSGTRDSTGEIVPLDTGYPDHIVEAFAFQLHNPFDAPLSLSATRNGRIVPDQTRERFNAVNGLANGASDKLPLPNDSQADEIRRVQLDEIRYYIEFSGRYYALVGTDGTHTDRRAITLEPGETRWFYVTDNNFQRIFNRMNNSDPTIRSVGQSDQPDLMIERWFRNQLSTLEPLGMSFVASEPSYTQRNALPRIPNSQNPENLVDGRNLRDLKRQPTFKNPPTRLLRINPITMQPVEPRPQVIPGVGEPDRRREFFDARRAVRLWRVQREVFTPAHANAGETTFESEGDRFPDGTTSYRRGNVPIANLLGNDALVDVLRDPNPWRRALADSTPEDRFDDLETTWTTPTLHRRVPDVADFRLDNTNAAINSGAQDGVAFINWGTIRRPADPKLGVPLYRDRVCNDLSSQDCDLLPEVPIGVIPAYCMEVKSSLPHRAGIEPLSPALSALSVRSSLNWDVVNGRRRVQADYTTDTTFDIINLPAASGPTGADITGSNNTDNDNFPRIQVARIAAGVFTGLPALVRKAMGDGRPGGIPVVLHQTINLAPQLQDNRSGDRFLDYEPRFNLAGGIPERERIRNRLQFLRNQSGIRFSDQYIQFPMNLPRIYDGGGKPLPGAGLRPADLLTIPAISPYETPLDLDGNLITDPDRRWTTLSEAIAQALDFDFAGELDWPLYNGVRTMPADYRLGATHVTETSDPLLGNNDIGGCLDRGCLRTDRFVPYLDLVDDSGATTANGEFDAPRDRFRDGRLIGDQRFGAGVPLALGLIDRFRLNKFGSIDSIVHGTINANTASAGVLRSVPMLSPDLTGWMGPSRRALMGFDNTRSLNYIGGGDVYSTNLYRVMDVAATSNFEQAAQLRSLYANWLETYDLAATLRAYRDKSVVQTRAFGRENIANFRFGIDVNFHDGQIFWPDGRRPNDIVARDDPAFARQFFTGIPALRESPGLAAVGELLCARYAGATRADTPQRAAIPNIETLYTELGNFPKADLDYPQDISIDRFARDGAKLAPAYEPSNDEFDLGLDVGKSVEGLTGAVYRNPFRQRGPFVPSSLPDDISEKFVIANAAMGSLSVRSDVFCAWFIVRGYTESDVNTPTPFDPAVPSVQKRFVMVLDRSNVKEMGDKPRIVFVQEVPMN